MRYFLIALLLLVSCKSGKGRIVDKAQALTIVKDNLSTLKGMIPIKCPGEEPRTPYYVCYGVKPANSVTVQNIDDALKTHFDLLSDWVFEYSGSATYVDPQENMYIGILYVTLSKTLGNDGLVPGYQKIVEVYIDDNPYK